MESSSLLLSGRRTVGILLCEEGNATTTYELGSTHYNARAGVGHFSDPHGHCAAIELLVRIFGVAMEISSRGGCGIASRIATDGIGFLRSNRAGATKSIGTFRFGVHIQRSSSCVRPLQSSFCGPADCRSLWCS